MTRAGHVSRGRAGSWGIRYREARAHALIAAVILWSGAAIATFATPGLRNLAGHTKGEDFLQIYTLAYAAFEGPYPTPAVRDAFHARQVELVPGSADDIDLPVYPPNAALMFRPLTWFSYGTALAIWVGLTLVAYGGIVWGAWSPFRAALSDRAFLIRGAIAFPPFFLLVLYGQTTILPLAAFFLCWLGIKANRPLAAGLALSLVAVKPQFGLVIVIALLVGRNWRVLLGAMAGAALQALAIIGTLGTQAIWAYRQTISELPQIEYLLEPDGWRMHSVRTLTRLLPESIGDMVWAAVSVVIVLVAARRWSSPTPLELRFGFVVLATVLVNPHLFGYDAVILVLPILWFGGWLEATASPLSRNFWQAVYLLSLMLLLPTALLLRVQGSVLVMLWMFVRMARAVRAFRSTSATP